MRILVVSDSHGDIFHLTEAVKREEPDLLFHLGDGIRDLLKLRVWYPSLPWEKVRGNCDAWGDGLSEQTIDIIGHKILMLHGHTKGVKSGLVKARIAAMKAEVEILLFGHTHKPLYLQEDGLHILNPGTIGAFSLATYGILDLEEGAVSCRLEQMY